MATKGSAGRGATITGIVLLVVGLLAATIGGILATSSAMDLVGAPEFDVPGEFTVPLEAGTQAVYEEILDSTTTLQPSQLTVTAPDGGDVPTRRPNNVNSEQIDFGTGVYQAFAEFEAASAGTYRIKVGGETRGTVLVAQSLDEAVAAMLPWIGLAALGGTMAFVGLIVLIVGLVAKGRAKRPVAPPVWLGPPGPPGAGGAPYPGAPTAPSGAPMPGPGGLGPSGDPSGGAPAGEPWRPPPPAPPKPEPKDPWA